MNAREFRARLGATLDSYGSYDRRHTAPLFSALPRRRTRVSPSAVLAAILVVAAAVVVALLPDLHQTAQSPIQQPVAPAGTPVPAPTPEAPTLLLAGSGWVRLDWSGHRLGTLQMGTRATYYILKASPDGSMLLGLAVGGTMVLMDGQDGHLLDTGPPLGDSSNVRWADDSRHLCTVNPVVSGTELVVADASPVTGLGRPRRIPVAGLASGSVTMAGACSFRTDRAVITGSQVKSGNESAQVVVVRLSDGTVILHRDYPAPAPFINSFVSSDGRFLVGSGSSQPVTRSVVADLSTGDIVASINGVGLAFSGDDRYLAVSSFTSETARPGGAGSLVEWRTGRTVWQGGPGQLAILAVEPGGSAIAVQLYNIDSQSRLQDLWLIVQPDRPAIPIKDVVAGSPQP
jgi:hypothetical protein